MEQSPVQPTALLTFRGQNLKVGELTWDITHSLASPSHLPAPLPQPMHSSALGSPLPWPPAVVLGSHPCQAGLPHILHWALSC